MKINDTIFKELIKRGYSKRGGSRVWDISDSKLWYLTPELISGFLALENYEPYKKHINEPELALIKEHAASVAAHAESKTFNLVDLGCGDGHKAEAFVKYLPKDVSVRYCPVDFSSLLLSKAVQRIRGLKNSKVKSIKKLKSDFTNVEDIAAVLRNSDYQKNVHLLLGSTLSMFELNDLLYGLSNGMFSGDILVIGNGVRKGQRFVGLDKYKSKLFDEWFIHIMHGLGFEKDEVKYDARFANGRLEGFYKVLADKTVTHEGKKIIFRKGDEVIVGIQYKYYPSELQKFCEMYFRKVVLHKDETNEFALIICVK